VRRIDRNLGVKNIGTPADIAAYLEG